MPIPVNKYRVQLPIWKAYLYDLINRIKLYRWVNMGLVTFGLTKREGAMINPVLLAYGRGDERHRPRAHRFNTYVQVIYTNMGIATKEEIAIADKLYPVTKLNTEDLIMEIKKLKTFAKEVGLKFSDYKELGEDDLIKLILANIDPAKEYSKPFAAWYGDLPEELFDDAESTPGKDDGKNTGSSDTADTGEEAGGEDEISLEDVMEVLEDDTVTLDDLKELMGEVDLFKGVSTKGIKSADKLRAKLLAVIEAAENGDEPGDESGEETGDELTADDLKALADEIGKIKSKDDLIEALADYEEVFGDDIDPDEHKLAMKLRKAMIAFINDLIEAMEGGVPEDELNEEPGDAIDPDAEYERYKALNIIELRKQVKADTGIETRSRKKADILEDVAAWLADQVEGGGDEPGEETEEAEINEALINEAEEAEDTDTLIAIADELGVSFNALDKRSAKRMAIKLRKNLPEDAGDSTKAAKGKAAGKAKSNKKADLKAGTDSTPEERVSLFKTIEAMMADGKTEEEIVNEVKPRLKARGVNLKTAKTKVRAYMQVIDIENAKEK